MPEEIRIRTALMRIVWPVREISESQFRELVRQGEIDGFKAGGVLYVYRESVCEWLEKKEPVE
jgi:hypothetical protein